MNAAAAALGGATIALLLIALGVLQGILSAAAVSVAVLMYQANRPPMDVVHDEDGVLVLRPDGRPYLANGRRTCGASDSLAIFGSPAEALTAAHTAR